MITVADLMSAEPITVTTETSLETVIGLMKEHRCRQLLVTEAGKLVGIVTDRDVRLAMNSPLVLHERADDVALLRGVTAGVCMTPNPLTVKPDDSAAHAARLIRQYKFGALPVVEGTKPVGIVTISDLLGSYITLLQVQAGSLPT